MCPSVCVCVYVSAPHPPAPRPCPRPRPSAVFRIDKLKPHIAPLRVPASVALDMYELEELHLAAQLKRQATAKPPPPPPERRSPSPQPGDVNYVDPDFDPDNVVIRGADTIATDNEADEEDDDAAVPPSAGRVGGNSLDDFS